jgi:hypothetical protein
MWIARSMVLGLLLSGCGDASETAADDTAGDFDGTDTQEARAASWQRLVGTWEADGAGLYSELVFSSTAEASGHHYFGMRVVTCVRAPCLPVREDGSFVSGTSNLTLRSTSGTLRLTYTLAGDALTLRSGTRVVARFHRSEGYCTTSSDCYDQGLFSPRCIGSWTCATNACAYRCGRPDPCASVRCAAGTHCSAPADAPMCVPDDPGPTCRTLTCASGTHCETVSGRSRCVVDADPCAVVRCASGTRCVASGSTASCVANGGGYGATCGGIAGLPCAADYTCVLASNVPDATGYCHGLAAEGGSCGGGSIRFPAVCDTGLHCVGPSSSAPGATGTCVRDSGPTCRTLTCASGRHCETVNGTGTCVLDGGGLGAVCGGIAALRCGAGYQCVITSRTPDATGYCHPESTLGGRCNGTTRFPPVCAPGLTCDGPEAGAPAGATGLCIR